MKPTLHVVAPIVDRELLATLRQLQREAEAGELLGFAYVATRKGTNAYSGDVVGRHLKEIHPLVPMGLARALEIHLAMRGLFPELVRPPGGS